jgi:hypothetical protein
MNQHRISADRRFLIALPFVSLAAIFALSVTVTAAHGTTVSRTRPADGAAIAEAPAPVPAPMTAEWADASVCAEATAAHIDGSSAHASGSLPAAGDDGSANSPFLWLLGGLGAAVIVFGQSASVRGGRLDPVPNNTPGAQRSD